MAVAVNIQLIGSSPGLFSCSLGSSLQSRTSSRTSSSPPSQRHLGSPVSRHSLRGAYMARLGIPIPPPLWFPLLSFTGQGLGHMCLFLHMPFSPPSGLTNLRRPGRPHATAKALLKTATSKVQAPSNRDLNLQWSIYSLCFSRTGLSTSSTLSYSFRPWGNLSLFDGERADPQSQVCSNPLLATLFVLTLCLIVLPFWENLQGCKIERTCKAFRMEEFIRLPNLDNV